MKTVKKRNDLMQITWSRNTLICIYLRDKKKDFSLTFLGRKIKFVVFFVLN